MSSGGKRRGVRRGREAEDHENEAPQPGMGVNDVNAKAQKVNPSKTFTFNRAYAEFPEKLIAIPAVGKKDAKLWEEQLLDDAQDNCVRRVLRLFLTKGAKGDVIRYVLFIDRLLLCCLLYLVACIPSLTSFVFNPSLAFALK